MTGVEPLWRLLFASVLGWILLLVGIVVVLVFARQRSYTRWLLELLAGAALILTATACMLSPVVSPGEQSTLSAGDSTPRALPGAGASLLSPIPSATLSSGSLTPDLFELTLFNNTEESVCGVYIAPAGSDEWGEDWLGADETILPGDRRTFQVLAASCDVLAEGCDGQLLGQEYALDVVDAAEWTLVP